MDKQYYFLDTNFLRQMSRRNRPDLVNWIVRLLTNPDQPKPVPIVTPFSRMEVIGIKAPKFNYQIPSSQNNIGDLAIILKDFKDAALHFFRSAVELSEDNIMQKLNETRSYIHPEFIESGLFAKHIEIQEEKLFLFRNDLCELLAVNALHAFDYPEHLRGAMHVIHSSAIIEEFNDNRNVCLLRSFRFFWNHRIHDKEKERYTEQEIGLFDQAMKLKPSEDLVDIELMHYLLFGYYDNSIRHSIKGFTSDKSVDRLVRRIQVFKGIASGIVAFLRELGLQTNDLVITPGILAKYDDDPEERCLLPVEPIPPF